MSTAAPSGLTGQLLIAMPSMTDPRFAHAVIYLCAHSDEGAMGLIVNKPLAQLRFADLLRQLDIAPSPATPDIRVQLGGPVESERGFVLHEIAGDPGETTLQVDDHVGLTATLDILAALAAGNGPRKALMALGYAGWGAGQLEDELAQNAWLTAPASDDILFGRAHEHKWAASLKSIGVDPMLLSGEGGRA